MASLDRIVRAALLCLALCAVISAQAARPVVAASKPATTAPGSAGAVPLVNGLTMVGATSEARGDYEALLVVDAVAATGYRLTFSGDVPSDDRSGMTAVSVVRRVRAVDARTSHRMRKYFHSGDPEQFTGTVTGFSTAMVDDLRRTGRTQFTYLEIASLFGTTMVKREHSGQLSRDARAPATRTVLVNGRRTALPVLRASGTLDSGATFAFDVLDDPRNPLVLTSRGPGFSTSVVRIEFPQPPASPTTIERTLADVRKADVYGIYFSFASDTLRPQSDAVLKEIAAALKQHPDWTLRIDGHTDGIGAAAANRALSLRRADAVKAALVTRHAIAATRLTTGGFGESRPKGDNATVDGRAANRRVELTRP